MNIPYDNGKIKIGINYRPDNRPSIDGDMEIIQTAFIGNAKEIRRRKMASVVYVGALLVTVFSVFLFN
jgi:hypothetical protein